MLKWVCYIKSENPPTTFHGKEGQPPITLFSKMVRNVLVTRAPARLRKLSGGCPLWARADARRCCYRARFLDSSGMIESQIKRGQEAQGIRSKVDAMIVIRSKVSMTTGKTDPEGTWKWLIERGIQKGKTERQAPTRVSCNLYNQKKSRRLREVPQ